MFYLTMQIIYSLTLVQEIASRMNSVIAFSNAENKTFFKENHQHLGENSFFFLFTS